LVFITEKKGLYSVVQAGSLNKAVCGSSVKGYYVFCFEKMDALLSSGDYQNTGGFLYVWY